MPTATRSGTRRGREEGSDVGHSDPMAKVGPSAVSTQLTDPLPPISVCLDALLTAIIKPDVPPVWIQVSARVYSILRLWYAPQALEAHYFQLLKRQTSNTMNTSSTNATGNGASAHVSSSTAASSCRTLAENEAMEIARRLRRRNDDELMAAGVIRNQVGGTSDHCHYHHHQRHQQQQEQTSSLPCIKTEPSTLLHHQQQQQQSSKSAPSIKQEVHSGGVRPANHRGGVPAVAAAGAAGAGVSSLMPTKLAAVKVEVKPEVSHAADSRISASGGNNHNNINNNGGGDHASGSRCHTLESLWTMPLSTDILNELILFAEQRQSETTRRTFELNPAPNVNVYQFGVPVGKLYREVVFRPTSLHTVREKVKSGAIKTLEQMYCEFSQMMANCCVFNLPGGYYPMFARSTLLQLVTQWSDFVARLE